jgi:hypothetical protein
MKSNVMLRETLSLSYPSFHAFVSKQYPPFKLLAAVRILQSSFSVLPNHFTSMYSDQIIKDSTCAKLDSIVANQQQY